MFKVPANFPPVGVRGAHPLGHGHAGHPGHLRHLQLHHRRPRRQPRRGRGPGHPRARGERADHHRPAGAGQQLPPGQPRVGGAPGDHRRPGEPHRAAGRGRSALPAGGERVERLGRPLVPHGAGAQERGGHLPVLPAGGLTTPAHVRDAGPDPSREAGDAHQHAARLQQGDRRGHRAVLHPGPARGLEGPGGGRAGRPAVLQPGRRGAERAAGPVRLRAGPLQAAGQRLPLLLLQRAGPELPRAVARVRPEVAQPRPGRSRGEESGA